MPDESTPCGRIPADDAPPVGIVVHDAAVAPRRPRSFAFVWAGEDFPAPSLPFGRWKARAA
jgi:hypothetical protein